MEDTQIFGINDLKAAFEAGRQIEYDAFDEDQYYHIHENFNQWYENYSGNLPHDIEKIVRFTISQWSSLKELEQPDHEMLVRNWIEKNFREWLKQQNI